MDWLRENHFLSKNEMESFNCNQLESRELQCRYLEVKRDVSKECCDTPLNSMEAWEGFMNSDNMPPGLHIFIMPPSSTDDIFDLERIPLSSERWATIAQRFKVHHTFAKQTLATDRMLAFSVIDPDELVSKETKLWMNVAISSRTRGLGKLHNRFAIASTSLLDDGITMIVILGIGEQQIELVKSLINEAQSGGNSDALFNPFFALRLNAELMIQRLSFITEDCRYFYSAKQAELMDMQERSKKKLNISKDFLWQVSEAQKFSRKLDTDITDHTRYLNRAMERSRSLAERESSEKKDGASSKDCTWSGKEAIMLQRRLEDIISALDDLLYRNRSYADEMSRDMEFTQHSLAQQEASNTARLADNSFLVALIGVIFLPASTLATIFAMPVIQWQKYPLDFGLRFVPDEETDSDQDPGNSTNASQSGSLPLNIITGYFWIYIICSVFITLLIISLMILRSRKLRLRDNPSQIDSHV